MKEVDDLLKAFERYLNNPLNIDKSYLKHFSIKELQDEIDKLYEKIIENQNNFGVQKILEK